MIDPREHPEWLQREAEDHLAARRAERRAELLWGAAIALTVTLGGIAAVFALARIVG